MHAEGINTDTKLHGLNFVDESMLYTTKDTFESILKFELKDAGFKNEDKQLDNTMAHSIEYVFTAGLIVTDKILEDFNSSVNKLSCKLNLNHLITL